MSVQSTGNDSLPAVSEKPSAARMYDYFLGGFHNFAIDRATAERVRAIYPDVARVMAVNRAFLRRAVRFLLAQGIDQFLDLGAGIATVGSVHEIVQGINPDAHVVYVDSDPVAVEHTRALLGDTFTVTVVEADARDVPGILTHPDVHRLLDFSRPVGVLIIALLHFIVDDDEAYGLVRALRDALAPGSYLAIAHATTDDVPEEAARQLAQLYSGTTNPGRGRSRNEIKAFFAGLTLVEPGVVLAPLWRPESPRDLFLDDPSRAINYVGVGLKPSASS